MRVGIGYDIHRLVPNHALILGGITFESSLGLDGHSDADVVVHALMDALLGAAALGDIGQHFPPTDEAFRDVSSLELLKTVRDLIAGAGFSIANVDIVVVAEEPSIAPHVLAMRRLMSNALSIDVQTVSIKATTSEGVGAEGHREAISAQAIALLKEL
jgi:2-C-methyl-D-erythritol 2,4-cyclodiphosphate synthase